MVVIVVSVAAVSGAVGMALGALLVMIALGRRRQELDDRDAALALAEMKHTTRPVRTIINGSAVVKPRDLDPSAPAEDESPAAEVEVFGSRTAELLAAGRSMLLGWFGEHGHVTAEFDGQLARATRSQRDRAAAVPAGALLAALADEREQVDQARRSILVTAAQTVSDRMETARS
jgi:hypothetical protein